MISINQDDILKAKLEIQEQALKLLIHEIHDNVGQDLSLARLFLSTLDLDKPKQVIENTNRSKELISKVIKDLRRHAKYLSTENFAWIGLPMFIENELSLVSKDRIYEPVLKVNGGAVPLSDEEYILLFRIIQEVIQFFILSSSTSVIAAEIHYTADALVITLLNKEKNQSTASNINENAKLDSSMHTVYNRIKLIGASFEISSILGNQTSIIITLPYSNP